MQTQLIYNKHEIFIFFLSIFILTAFSFSCSEADSKSEIQEFVIKVDSIQLPDSVAVNEQFDVKFFLAQ